MKINQFLLQVHSAPLELRPYGNIEIQLLLYYYYY